MAQRLRRRQAELPPTAGLALGWRDLLPGPDALERTLAAQLGVEAPQLTCSGSAAFMVALATLREQAPGRDQVVVPAYTCPLVALAIQQVGLQIVPCDVAPGGFDFDRERLQALCSERTLAVVPTHLGGRVADVATAIQAALPVGAFVVEDAAQSLGARLRGRSVGLMGDVGFFSLAVGKGLTTYEGGLLFTADPDLRTRLARAAQRMLPPRLGWELRRSAELLGYATLYRPRGLRWAYGAPLRRALRRGHPVAAVGDDFSLPLPQHRVGRWRRAVGTRAAARLPAFLAACAERAARHLPRLQALPGIRVLADAPGNRGVWPFFILLLPDQRCRDAALDRLWRAGLGVSRLFIHALPDYRYLRAIVPDADLPNARNFAARMLTIGNSPWLEDGDMAVVLAELERVLR